MTTSPSRLRGPPEVASNAFLAELDRYTIGEVAQPKALLAAWLGLGGRMPDVSETALVSGGNRPTLGWTD
ncbi:hypothetical protein [Paraburkholderia susongensis]|uniref:hypothetical protein n=1 Tax=Paraburkholderia susongensis TaxID=1515439 RepID=UPI000A1C9580|nr:hypothetical protein [Paraburkholderia susongensis]